MDAWTFDSFGLDALTRSTMPAGVLGPAEVRVEVRAVSLNYRDLLMVRGAYDPRVLLPLVPCSDAAGVVVECGPEATVPLGTRVMVAFAPAWKEGPPHASYLKSTLGGPVHGTLRQTLCVAADAVVPIPEHLSFQEASTLPCAGVTAWNALEVAQIGPGSPLLALGTGGVSTFALQLATARGASVTVTSSSASKAARARALGAVDTLDYTEQPRWGREISHRTGGVAGVIEVGGVGTLNESLRACRAGGTIALIGVLAGAKEPLSLTRALMYGIRIQGIMVGSVADLRSLADEVDQTRLRPVIDRVFPFDQAPAAFAHLASGTHQGKVVISG